MSDGTALDVRLHGERIGTLTDVGGDRTLLAFTDAYVADPERAVLGLGIRNARGALASGFKTYQTRLPPWFSDLLPEAPLRGLLAGRAGVNPERELSPARTRP